MEIVWIPSKKGMDSIPHSMEATSCSMDSIWNNPGRVKYCLNYRFIQRFIIACSTHTNNLDNKIQMLSHSIIIHLICIGKNSVKK